MLALHQRTRRRICQAGFCLLCAFPTTGLLSWAASLKTASHLAGCERRISERLGLLVSFKQVNYPQPGQTHYEGLELADAETGDWLLRCRALDVVRSGRKLALDPHDVEVAEARADKLLRLVLRRLARELPGDEAVALVPTQVTLKSDAGSQTYDDVAGRIELEADSSSALLRFQLPEFEAGEPPQVSLIRRQTEAGVRTATQLDTLGATLPVSVFSPWLKLDAVLGGDASFNGSLTVEEAGGQYSCNATGVFEAVDLERLIGRRFPHHITGNATLQIQRAELRADKLLEAVGVLRSPSGTIGGSLLTAAVELLGCEPAAGPAGDLPFAANQKSVYRDLNVAFTIDERGLVFRSVSEGQPIIRNGDDKALLFEGPAAPQPLLQLVRLLVPASDVQVPATKETAQLMRWLPVPPLSRAADSKPDAPPLRYQDGN